MLQIGTYARVRAFPCLATLLTFATTLFLSAGLMFMVQPMMARMVLPRLGGAPAVWSTCMMFFQAILLLGYAYAYALTRWLTRRTQVLVHIGLLLPLAALALPIELGPGAPRPGEAPSFWLLLHLALGAGLPVFAISATAPLLQSWFAGVDHPASGDPYFLYAGSNAGSLLGLISYPFLVEPGFSLQDQALMWSLAFGGFAIGVVLCGLVTVRTTSLDLSSAVPAVNLPGRLRQRTYWVVLAFVPSSMLLGVTTHITSDVASVPLLWVIPLALYLLSFIVAFARRPLLPHAIMIRVLPFPLIFIVMLMAAGARPTAFLPVQMTLHLCCFFAVAMVCHGELARTRPSVAQLTEFYFFLSLSGVAGGVFNALLAPVIFPAVWEYPLVLVAACLAKPALDNATHGRLGDLVLPLILLAFLLLGGRFLSNADVGGTVKAAAFVCMALAVGVILLHSSARRLRFALGVSACLLVPALTPAVTTLMIQRSFFGVHRVLTETEGNARFLTLVHGTTLHGARSLLPGEETLPTTYYSPDGPFGRFLRALPQAPQRVAVIGLGTGALSCYAKPGQQWTFYEIDPVVEQIARDPRYFGFLAACGNSATIVLGDARLMIADAPDAAYDALIVDAFSSDSIPMHLLTREAMALYLRKLAPDGRILFHITSQRLDLRPVIASLAADAGVSARAVVDRPVVPDLHRAPSVAVAVAGRRANLDGLSPADGWADMVAADPAYLWTDQRSDILRVIRFGLN